jgi:sec-independent protein translocase protein TatA
LIVVLVIVLLIFGPGKLPELGKAVGDGLRELKKATGNDDHKDTAALPATTTAPMAAVPVAPTPISTAPTVAARACPSCRGSVPVGDKFCGNCGATMEAVTRSA